MTEEKSRAHSAFKLAQIKQKPNENLRIFILRYQDLHAAATGKTAAEDTDPTHIITFLEMMTNSEIARKITQKGIPEGMTLGQAFPRAIKLEAGYQLSEGVSLARPPEIMQVQEIEEVDEIGAGQRRSRDVVCWQCGEKGHLQHDCPHKAADGQDDDIDDPNAYAGKSKQIIRITQPITVATRDNIYKQMGSQRTNANLYRAGYRKTKAALQEQQRINAAMATTLTTQNTMTPAQATVVPPRVFQSRATQAPVIQQTVAQPPVMQQPQVTQVPSTPAQVIQMPTTPGPSAAGNVQAPQKTVRYIIRVSAGVTKATYNPRPATLNNATASNTSATVTATPVTVGRGWNNLQTAQVKQEPPTPGSVTTPKTTSTTTVIRKGKGRGKKTSTVNVLDTTPETGEYFMEVEEDGLENSDSDATELYEILANMSGPQEEIEMNLEPEMEPPI